MTSDKAEALCYRRASGGLWVEGTDRDDQRWGWGGSQNGKRAVGHGAGVRTRQAGRTTHAKALQEGDRQEVALAGAEKAKQVFWAEGEDSP